MRKKNQKLDRHGRRIAKRRRRNPGRANPGRAIDFAKLDLVAIGRGMQIAGKVIELAGEIQAMRVRDDAKKKTETESN